MARYLTTDEINTRLQALADDPANAGIVTVFKLDKPSSADGRDIKCIRISKAPADKPPVGVLIVGGVHAREWAPPDSLVDFAERLVKCFTARKPYVDPRFVLDAKKSATDGSYTGTVIYDETKPDLFSLPDIDRVFKNLEVFIVPCVNPDGRNFSQQAGTITGVLDRDGKAVPKFRWRKNRKDYGVCTDGGPAIGVDINRNFDLPAWNIELYFKNGPTDLDEAKRHTAVAKDFGKLEGNFFQNYHGPSAGSENETQNIQKLITDKKIRFFLDIHGFHGEIYWPWGFNPDQPAGSPDPTQSQFNPKWNNIAANPPAQQGRPFKKPATFSEFFPTSPAYDLLDSHQKLAGTMAGLIQLAAGTDVHAKARSNYATKQSIDLYPTAGSSDDFALNTQLEKDPVPDPTKGDKVRIKPALFPVFAFTIEVGLKDGSDGEFWPSISSTSNQFLKVRREAQFAVIAMLKYAATWSPVVMSTPPASGSTSKGCLSMIILLITFASLSVFSLFYWFL
ncbi:M14 family zinc carboxypeptidase [Puia sp.]|jgi:hypothetical protein|uniref:M14 family zinc carboxypeptidase n=1 Tax=Puia sp. TaxID=2045100 RepID=UPI002F40B5CD